MPHKHKPSSSKKSFEAQIEGFKQKAEELQKNFQPIFIHTAYAPKSRTQKAYETAMQCHDNNEASVLGLSTEVLQNRSRTPVPVSTCGAEDRGYIRAGADNLLYAKIQKAAQSLYLTSSTLRYIIELLCGGGFELRYHYTRINAQGEPEDKSCSFEQAGTMLKARIAKLRQQLKEEQQSATAPANSSTSQPIEPSFPTVFPSAILAPSNEPSHGEDTFFSYRTRKQPEPTPDPYATRTYDDVGTTASLLSEAIQDLRTWERSMAEWTVLKANSSDLDVLLNQWASDQTYFSLSHLRLSLECGTPGSWGKVQDKKLVARPKIVGVDYIPTVCARMEEMSDALDIEHIYYAERFRYEGTIKDQNRDIVAYPNLMPNKRNRMLTDIVLKHQTTKPRKRPQVAMPIYVPQFDSPYYPVASWWSIFSSLLFMLAKTIVNDASTERKNTSMFSYLIYLNMSWFDKYCADHGAETDEERDDLKNKYIRTISDFLKNKSNNGKIAALESLSSADERSIIKSIEIQEIPRPASKASLQDMELIGNAVFFALGIHGSLVGSFGNNVKSSSGTQQRELTLLKSCQLSPQQRLYLNAWKFILDWNDFDPHAYPAIKQHVLTTLDANKTGIEEM